MNNLIDSVYCDAIECKHNVDRECTRDSVCVNLDSTAHCEDYDEGSKPSREVYTKAELVAFQRGLSCLLDSMEPMLRNGDGRKHVDFLEALLSKVVEDIRA